MKLTADYILIFLSMLLFAPLNNVTRRPKSSERGTRRASIHLRHVALGLLIALPSPSRWIFDGGQFDALERLQDFAFFIQLILSWRFVTRDFDVTQRLSSQRRARFALIACLAGSYFYPPALLAWIYISRNLLPDWQHHITMPARMVQMYLTLYMSTWVLSCVGAVLSVTIIPSLTPYIVLLGCVQLSHYLRPGLSKLKLGSNWFDWMLHNKTHLLAISAYHWGWAGFVNATTAHGIVKALAPWIVPLNGITLLIETLPLFSFLDVRFYIAMLGFMSMLNLAIFLLSGILFWEYMLTNLAFAFTLVLLDGGTDPPIFGFEVFLISLALLTWPVVLKKIWHPSELAWWDGPFVGRIRWQVQGASGAVYGLYNDFMCPYEREYGRMYGYFLAKEKIVHGHLGLVPNKSLVQRVQATNGDPKLLDAVKEEHGVSLYDPRKIAEHERFLVSMFANLNNGLPKNILPSWFRWLKAPGGQYFYWGCHPAYRRQEKVRKIDIYYQEAYFDEPNYRTIRLCNRLIKSIDIE